MSTESSLWLYKKYYEGFNFVDTTFGFGGLDCFCFGNDGDGDRDDDENDERVA